MDSVIFNGIEYRRFDHLYWVSACGQFLRRLDPYQPWLMANGYLAVGRRRLAHRMVATCWCPKPEGAEDVHHINEIRTDNHAENLVWLTTAEHLKLHPDRSRGHTMSEEGRARLRSLRLGSKTTEETKAKQREAILRLGIKPPPRQVGIKMGPEFSARMKAVNQNRRACVIHGERYASFQDASQALGIKPHTLRKRCLADSFPDYRLEE